MKKIIYLISSLKENGPNKVLLSMINGINKEKYEVYIVSFLHDNDMEYVEIIKKKVKKVYLLNLKKKHQIIFKGKNDFEKIVNDINPNIIHSHGILPDIVNGKIKTNAKRITTIHDNMFEDYVYSFGKFKGNIYIRWHLYYIRRFDKCVCCSSSTCKILKKYLKNTTYIRNAIFERKIDDKEYMKNRESIRTKYNIGKNDIVYIYAGNLSKLKNVIEMVVLFNRCLKNNEYLFILGSGKLQKKLKNNIKNNHIIFVGFTSKVKEYMCASDIYTSFSSSEGFSISVLEALETYNLLLLSGIPSHKEIFGINSKYYLGDTFEIDNFDEKKNKLTKRQNIDDLNEFLNKYLSIKKMMERYCKIYDNR